MNLSSLFGICFIDFCSFVRKTINHAMKSTTSVRIAVPRLESTSLIPILPKIAVSAANIAERHAYISHFLLEEYSLIS